MIWVTDDEGRTTYMCPEWYAVTVLRPPAGLFSGWASVIHPDDRDLMVETFRHACAARCEFTLQYRLRRQDGTYVWVSDSATPSWLPKRRGFLGFFGQITDVKPEGRRLIAQAELERFEVTPSAGEFAPVTALDALAEHVLMARSLALGGASDHLLPMVDALLFAVGKDLARRQAGDDASVNIH
ncbi:PAS domain-containing protein [Methylobacterium sp. J-070]|uniref:PAS domain-containing protein n=1 Tax=Methylobacterium sp. J-070 TaxID=2836650 RepID=UPI001FB87CC1|nr:PAS domain-containing protein [Methylobacterium sp. J-070]MCJ2050082.1 PAS domain-containing protein [Methylobacterium sp. J-070]